MFGLEFRIRLDGLDCHFSLVLFFFLLIPEYRCQNSKAIPSSVYRVTNYFRATDRFLEFTATPSRAAIES